MLVVVVNLASLCISASFEKQTAVSTAVQPVPRLATTWANASYFVLILGNRRGATTETAEHIGNHPCAASFNELVLNDHFPVGYQKYNIDDNTKYGKGMQRYLKIKRLHPNHQLSSALKARTRFCNARPDAVKRVCGDVCVIAFKVHLDKMNVSEEFYADRRTRAVVLERDRLQNFCSNFWAYTYNDYGHTPSVHKTKDLVRPPCTLANVLPEKGSAYFRKSWKGAKGNYAAYDALITPKFKAIRRHLHERNRSTLEMPFEEYIADTAGANRKLWKFAGLLPPPNDWGPVCPYAWCSHKLWPFPL
jgi:hypothetical protein